MSSAPTFISKTPHFFKIILDDTIRDGKLGIPRRFVSNYGNDLSSPVLLKVPSGRIWQVELTKNHDGEVWLQKGWQGFAEYYSLDHGHFLVFRYEGKSHFYVLIFDTSASEIEYPFHTNQEKEFQVPKMEGIETDNAAVEILEGISASQKRRKKTQILQHFLPRQKMKTTPTEGTEIISNVQKLVPYVRANGTQANQMELDDNSKRSRSGGRLNDRVKEGGSMLTVQMRCQQSDRPKWRTRSLTADEKIRALQRASSFKSENPYFTVAMQPSYVRSGADLNIPMNFAKKYLTKTTHGDIISADSDGRTWPIKYIRKVSYGNKRYKIYSGWEPFVKDKNLEVGDVCVFELIKDNKITFKVVIFRDVEGEHCCLPVGDQLKPAALEAADEFKSEYPFYRKVMTHYNVKGKLAV